MTLMHDSDRQLLASCADELGNWILQNIRRPVIDHLGVEPKEPREIQNRLQELKTELRSRPANDPVDFHEVPDDALPILKCALVHKRKVYAYELMQKSKLTFNHELKIAIDEKLEPFTSLMNNEWFKTTRSYQLPKITDFLALKSAEEFLKKVTCYELAQRDYDEKFQILNAPSLMLKDLRYYRLACEIRSSSVSVAYLDIDKFKDFNTKYGEPRIDRDLLPKFMSILESHVFSCGQAYRYGGDEYMIILPGTDAAEASKNLSKLQNKLAEAKYFEINENPTVSIGVFEVDDSCFLTDSEVEDKAAEAKAFAKSEGRNCIALCVDYVSENAEFSIHR